VALVEQQCKKLVGHLINEVQIGIHVLFASAECKKEGGREGGGRSQGEAEKGGRGGEAAQEAEGAVPEEDQAGAARDEAPYRQDPGTAAGLRVALMPGVTEMECT